LTVGAGSAVTVAIAAGVTIELPDTAAALIAVTVAIADGETVTLPLAEIPG
jgi:hypothetical protein